MPTAIHRPSVETETITATNAESLKNPTLKTTAATAAAETNHFSWRRSTPVVRRYRMTTDTTDSSRATTSASTAITTATRAASTHAPASTSRMSRNGWDQMAVARITEAASRTTSIATVIHPTVRHR